MIEILITYGELVWLLVIYLAGKFLQGALGAAAQELINYFKDKRENKHLDP